MKLFSSDKMPAQSDDLSAHKAQTQKQRLTYLTKNFSLFFSLLALGLIFDQASKIWAREALSHAGLTVFPHLLSFDLAENAGAAFSIAKGASWLFIAVTLLVLLFVIVYIYKNPQLSVGLIISAALLSSGGLGNLIDRILKSTVTDFIKLDFISFPIFNVADIFVFLGVLTLFLQMFIFEKSS